MTFIVISGYFYSHLNALFAYIGFLIRFPYPVSLSGFLIRFPYPVSLSGFRETDPECSSSVSLHFDCTLQLFNKGIY